MENRYAAYMLRLWQVGDGDSAVWRASLEDPHTGERCAFANQEALFAFLDTLTQRLSPSETATDDVTDPLDSEST
jgi:hypothetical protein